MKNHRLIIFFSSVVLSLLGVLFVFEAGSAESFATFGNQYYYVKQHSIGLLFGSIAFLVGFFTPTKLWLKFSAPIYILGLLLLLLVFIPGIGVSLNGAQRWISIAGFNFQPVEFFKFALVLFYANWLSKHQKITPFLFLTALPALLIILQPNLSSLLIIVAIAFALFFTAGGNYKQILGIGVLAIPAVLLAIVTSEYRMKRLTTFLNPEADPLGASFHIRQITLALGRGGWLGQGIGGSQQKYSYIPEASSDSIFAIIAEEIGFLGSLGIISLYVLFFYHAYKLITQQEKEPTFQLLGFGIIFWIGLQLILNLSAIVGLVPLTGVPLPFISYGRSSLVMLLFATGVLLGIGRTTDEQTGSNSKKKR